MAGMQGKRENYPASLHLVDPIADQAAATIAGRCYRGVMDEKLLNLPWEIQLALGSGYLAYMLAYLGIRDHHKPIDTTFKAIAFGLCATAVLKLMPSDLGWWRLGIAAAAPIAAAVLWRVALADAVQWFARKIDLTWADETPSAWSRITQHNRRFYYSQVSVQLDDDSILFCNDTRPFADAPYGPCTLGPSGDVALYVTHKCTRDSEIKPVDLVRDPFHGDELTYVPASRVRRVTVRLVRPINGSAEVVAAPQEEA